MIVTVQLAEAGEGSVGNAAGADSSLDWVGFVLWLRSVDLRFVSELILP